MTTPTGEESSALGVDADRGKASVQPIYGARRTRIRDELRRFLHDARLSHRGFAAILNSDPKLGITTNESAIRRFLNPNPRSSKVSDKLVLAIETYLNTYVRPGWEEGEPEDPAPPPASLFDVARVFFGMGRHKVRQYHRSVPGIYRFYAYSESEQGMSAVCVGAIRFDEDFDAEELQTSTQTGRLIREAFEGHYFYRGDSLIAMLRNKNGRQPKFYILSIPSYDTVDGKREAMSGLQIKTGEARDVFGAAVHMVRDDGAFEGTNVVPRAQVDSAILRILDSGQWLPSKASSR